MPRAIGKISYIEIKLFITKKSESGMNVHIPESPFTISLEDFGLMADTDNTRGKDK